ncbi:AfsR/SARP family transcriptional regulator [Jidongwangia harbinensis]|uniref:AfsR/SARP family transcriptional regulator n=1 Tax=Jidongwangia harbinensis TaxID=2878561 RepID=UPI001CD94224|nr:BTAD domain-containing putative transcriptional regulator [Jidongwangia harbinensis]MCA2214166.1 tetratricopeptide repeat protein [Jidongwangia harbinensis]
MKFLILGPLSVTHGDRPVVLTGRRQRTALAVLLANAGRVVPLEYLIDAVWDDAPPATARRQIQNDVSALRRALSGDGARPGCIVADGHGYRIETRPGELDAEVFQALVTEAFELTQRDEPAAAAAALRSALRQWRGPALTGLTGRAVEAAAVRLEEQRLAALEQCLDLELNLGRQRELVSEIAELVAAHPLRERLVGQLMLALHGSGRQSEALAAYDRLRARLADELGLSPGTHLQRLHAAILRNEPAVGPLPQPAAAAPAVPAQLPADVPGFTGRADHLRTLDRLLPDGDRRTAHAVAVAGLAGVGKTALVVHWGHRVRDRFPDGQLYLDLRGFTPGAPVRPDEALAHLLRSLGEPAEQIPADVQTAAGRYRSLLADRRVLVVLDNAATADQVRPLMPASPGSVVLVTSRDRLTGLVARDGAGSLILDVLDPGEAHTLLAGILGPQRVAAEPAAAAELAGICSHLPLALRVAAANLAGRPWSTIAAHVAALRDGDRLAGLDVADDEQTGVRRAFDLSYQTLHPDARRVFRLVGLAPGPDVTAGAVAALAATGAADARRQLDRLAAAHLMNHHAPGRYHFHDLLRHYAAGRALAEDTGADRDAALRRLIDWYLQGAGHAADLLYPHPLRLPVPAPEVPVPAEMADGPEALTWLDAERGNLTAAIRHAAEHGPRSGAWLLADTLRGYFWLRMHTTDWRNSAEAALAAARREGDLRAQASALLSLGDLHFRQARPEPAVERYAAALALAERTGWRECEAAAIGNLGVLYRDSGRLREAVVHLRRGVALARTNGSRYGEASALDALGRTYWHLGRLAEAGECCAQALAINRAIGSRLGEAAALGDLGEIAHAQGNHPTAVDRLARALVLFREIGDRTNQAHTLRALAAVRCDRGDTVRAGELGHAALVRARELDDRRIEADALNTLGAIAHRTDRHSDAVGYHERALALTRTSGDHYPETEALLGLAVAYRRLGHRDRALEYAGRALAIADRFDYGLLERRALGLLGHGPLVAATGRPDHAG